VLNAPRRAVEGRVKYYKHNLRKARGAEMLIPIIMYRNVLLRWNFSLRTIARVINHELILSERAHARTHAELKR